jgi:lipopolysaccharide transport system ATP-binding protein
VSLQAVVPARVSSEAVLSYPSCASVSDSTIEVQNLGKKYRINHEQQGSYTALRDVLTARAKQLLGKSRGALSNSEDFWALRNVSFDVRQGDVIGIIGRNGAGKSTLLKVLSRITEPTEGRVRIRGRVASLLEVGTGFHPELTGRENIFLNGAILGMSSAEIRRNFADIVAFAEIDRFLDTPVKRYSSGMYVRLAFAVAAHLQPEVLIVDEVLAVGDAEFQKKCLGKMQDVSRGGRTVLFVSHNMAAIRHLCTKAMYLVDGELRCTGSVDEVVDTYLTTASSSHETRHVSANGLALAEFKLCAVGAQAPLTSAIFGQDYEVRFTVRGDSKNVRLTPALRVYDDAGTLISSVCGPEEGIDFASIQGSRQWVVQLRSLPLFPGRYSISLQMFGLEPKPYLEAHDILAFTVEGSLIDGATRSYRSDHGLMRICTAMTTTDGSR